MFDRLNRGTVYWFGALSALLYTSHVILGAWLWPGYSHLHQPISDLTGSGAPNRPLLLSITTTYGVLAFVFAASIALFERKQRHRLIFFGSLTFMALHLFSLVYGLFPEDLPGTETTFQGFMHLVITALIVPFTIATPFLFGAGYLKEPGWKTFGKYSLLTGGLILVLGSMTAYFFANKLPYFGLVERLNIGALQLWTFVFSIKLVHSK